MTVHDVGGLFPHQPAESTDPPDGGAIETNDRGSRCLQIGNQMSLLLDHVHHVVVGGPGVGSHMVQYQTLGTAWPQPLDQVADRSRGGHDRTRRTVSATRSSSSSVSAEPDGRHTDRA